MCVQMKFIVFTLEDEATIASRGTTQRGRGRGRGGGKDINLGKKEHVHVHACK